MTSLHMDWTKTERMNSENGARAVSKTNLAASRNMFKKKSRASGTRRVRKQEESSEEEPLPSIASVSALHHEQPKLEQNSNANGAESEGVFHGCRASHE